MIGILMAVYNGEAYLREQLSSIFAGIGFLQRRVPRAQVRLLVSDDGSTDGSLAILEEYKKKYPQSLELLHGKTETEKGAAGNFFFLLREAQKREEVAYWLFADQDDVWFPEKILKNVEGLARGERRFGKDTPLLLHSDAILTDRHLRPLGGTMHGKGNKGSFSSLLVENRVTGNTMACNKALLSLYISPKKAVMHDWWLALLAAGFGKIIRQERPLVFYRQHETNALGAEKQGFLQNGRTYFSKKRQEEIRRNYDLLYRQAESFFYAYRERLRHKKYQKAALPIRAFLHMEKKNRLTKIWYCLRYGFLKRRPLMSAVQLFRI